MTQPWLIAIGIVEILLFLTQVNWLMFDVTE